jgi:hypothetical protein
VEDNSSFIEYCEYFPEAMAARSRCQVALAETIAEYNWRFIGSGSCIIISEDNTEVGYWVFQVQTSFMGKVWLVVGGALPPTMVLYDRADELLDVVLFAIESRYDYFAGVFGAKWFSDFERPFLWDMIWGHDLEDLLAIMG